MAETWEREVGEPRRTLVRLVRIMQPHFEAFHMESWCPKLGASLIGVPVRSGPDRVGAREEMERQFFFYQPFQLLDAGCAISRRAVQGRVGRFFSNIFRHRW